MSMNRYKIRSQAQKPMKVFLVDPATGEHTEDWVEVRSSLSDEFMEARDAAMRAVQGVVTPDKAQRKAEVGEIQLEMKSSLVAGWSFEEPCTKENIIEFLREAPQIQQMLLNVADDSARFFSKPSEGSKTGRKQS